MKSHNPTLEKQGNGQQTSPSSRVNPYIHQCRMPSCRMPYLAQTPETYVLPHPPAMYHMSPNLHQPAQSQRNYQQFSTQTDVSTDDANQPSSAYPNQSNQNEQLSQSPPIATSQLHQQSVHPYYSSSQASEQQPSSAYPSQYSKNEQSSQSSPPVTLKQPLQLAPHFYSYSNRPVMYHPSTAYPSQCSQKDQFSPSSPNVAPQQSQQPPPPNYSYPAQPGAYQYQPHHGPWQATVPPPPGYYYGVHYPVQPPKASDAPSVRETPFRRPSGEEVEPEGWTGFLDKKIRAKFIRKVYIILTLQLLFTLGIIALFIYEPHVKGFVQEHRYLTYVAMAVFLSVYIGLACFKSVRRRFPANIIALVVFTMAMSYMAAAISTFYSTDIVLIAVGICAAVCFTVTIFSFYTKFDFTTCGGILCILLLILFICGIITIFFPTMVMRMIYAGLGATVFSFMLAYDTQLMMGGKHYELHPEEHIFAAVQIYLDIVYIFLFLLMLLGGGEE